MGTTRKFLYADTTFGGAYEQASDDELSLGGLAVGSVNINGSTNIISGVTGGTSSGQVIVYGQSSASLAGLTLTSDLAMGDNNITGLGAPSNDGDATNKLYVDQKVINGGTFKEALLHEDQLSDSLGILGAGVLTIATNPSSGDTITITDGSTPRTYGAGSGGDVQYTIGGTVADTMANLASAINGDGSALCSAEYTTSLDGIDADGVVVLVEDSNASTALEIYGTWGTPANCQIVDFTDEVDYTKKTLTNLPGSDPSATNFGVRRTQANLTDGELHYVLHNDVVYGWDDSGNTWQTVSGSASIPDATSGSGGGVKGKVTFDSDKGLSVSSGIAEVVLESDAGIVFDAGNGGLEINLEASNPTLQISTNQLGLKMDSSGGLQTGASGVSIKTDESPDTLDVDSDGLKVVGLPSEFKINGSAVSANVTHTNLNTLTGGTASNADSLHTHVDVKAEKLEDELVAVESITAGDPIEWSTTANKIQKCQASTASKVDCFGVAIDAISADGTGTVVRRGLAPSVLSSATPGTRYFVGDSGGLVAGVGSISAGNHVVLVGTAANTDDLEVHPQYMYKKVA
jgi:hypothetical protein